MSPEKLTKVLERLGTTDGVRLVLKREPEGKIRVTSKFWEDAKMIGRGEVLEIRNVEGRLHIARRPLPHGEWGRPVEPRDCSGAAEPIDESAKS
jgi:hypothetical protein